MCRRPEGRRWLHLHLGGVSTVQLGLLENTHIVCLCSKVSTEKKSCFLDHFINYSEYPMCLCAVLMPSEKRQCQ